MRSNGKGPIGISVKLKGYGCNGLRFPIRGGNWNNGASAGLGALNLNNRRVNLNSNVGFRPALPLSQKSYLYGGMSRVEGKRSCFPSRTSRENINRHERPVGVCQPPLMPPLVSEAA
jgi:hypothetical protein